MSFVGSNKVACQLFVPNAGVPYVTNLSLFAHAAFGSYLNIASYQWYKNNITTGGTIYLLFVLCVVISSTIANPFRMGTENIRNCTVSLIHMHSMMIYNLVWESFVSCCT
uniref:Uncharacterized protein n=1 Tax=Daphnia magna TaxID=35525 RepID=A0A0P5TSF8_9CRUS